MVSPKGRVSLLQFILLSYHYTFKSRAQSVPGAGTYSSVDGKEAFYHVIPICVEMCKMET